MARLRAIYTKEITVKFQKKLFHLKVENKWRKIGTDALNGIQHETIF